MRAATHAYREEYVHKKRKQKIRRFVVCTVLLLALVGLCSYGLYRPGVRVQNVSLSGELLVDPVQAEKETLEYLSGSYLYLVPRDSIFFYPKNDLVTYLRQKFPRIEDISVSREGLTGLAVSIKERGFAALWCGEDPSVESVCYFMDSNAMIFAEAPHFSGDAYMVYYGKVSGDPVGAQFINRETFAHIQKIVEEAKSLQLFPSRVVFTTDTEYNIILHTGARITISTKDDTEKIVEHMALLVKNLSLEKIENLEYIDMRFGNKLFYKFKTDPAPAATDTAQDKTE